MGSNGESIHWMYVMMDVDEFIPQHMPSPLITPLSPSTAIPIPPPPSSIPTSAPPSPSLIASHAHHEDEIKHAENDDDCSRHLTPYYPEVKEDADDDDHRHSKLVGFQLEGVSISRAPKPHTAWHMINDTENNPVSS